MKGQKCSQSNPTWTFFLKKRLSISVLIQGKKLFQKISPKCPGNVTVDHCTEVRFASLFSGGFITAIVVNPPERKLAKRTSVQCAVVDAEACLLFNL